MEKFIEKMEALLRSNTKGFMGILLLLTVFGLGIYFVVSFCLRGKIDEKYDELLKLYVENASWMLFVAGILWIILLGTQQENKEGDKLDRFLEERGDKEFIREDLVSFIYGKKFKSTSSQYKVLGKLLRDAIKAGRIRELNPGENPRKYKFS